jgi:hypothetical protein
MNAPELSPLAALLTCALTCAPSCTPFTAPAEARIELASRIPRAQCDDAAPGDRAAQVLGMPGLLGVAPLTATVRRYKGMDESRLLGVEIRYAAPPGVTPMWLQRELECHQADVVLGRAPARADDPYVAPDEWLGLDVGAAGSALVVQVSAASRRAATASVERARRLYARAQVR